jgi:hypothetical protein
VRKDGAQQGSPSLISQPDKQGGVFIIWADSRGPSSNRKYYGQHLNASGVNQWSSGGKRLTSEIQDIYGPANFIIDGSNGLILGYSLSVSYYDQTIFGQRVSNNGSVLWDTLGLPICSRKWGRSMPEVINLITIVIRATCMIFTLNGSIHRVIFSGQQMALR